MKRGQGGCGLCEVVVCGLGLHSLAWAVWLARARVLRLEGSQFRELVVGCGVVPLHQTMGAARDVRLR